MVDSRSINTNRPLQNHEGEGVPFPAVPDLGSRGSLRADHGLFVGDDVFARGSEGYLRKRLAELRTEKSSAEEVLPSFISSRERRFNTVPGGQSETETVSSEKWLLTENCG